MQFPNIGLGTRQLTGNDCIKIVDQALNIGYKMIDTAQIYGNECDVGLGIKNAGISRTDIFITTKIWISNFGYEKTLSSFEQSLSSLGVEYIDLVLLHWPQTLDLHHQTLDALMLLKSQGKVLNIGVSNFNIALLKDAHEYTGGNIFTNQFEYHVFLDQNKLIETCNDLGISYTAYSPLASGHIKGSKDLITIGEKYGKNEFQVGLKWLLKKGAVVIPKSSSVGHLNSNFDIFDFELSNDDLAIIEGLPKHHRYLNPPFAPLWD